MTIPVLDRLLRLDVRCPKCSAPPKLRIPETQRDRYRRDDPTMVILTYQCQRRVCQERYALTAGSFSRAS